MAAAGESVEGLIFLAKKVTTIDLASMRVLRALIQLQLSSRAATGPKRVLRLPKW